MLCPRPPRPFSDPAGRHRPLRPPSRSPPSPTPAPMRHARVFPTHPLPALVACRPLLKGPGAPQGQEPHRIDPCVPSTQPDSRHEAAVGLCVGVVT